MKTKDSGNCHADQHADQKSSETIDRAIGKQDKNSEPTGEKLVKKDLVLHTGSMHDTSQSGLQI